MDPSGPAWRVRSSLGKVNFYAPLGAGGKSGHDR